MAVIGYARVSTPDQNLRMQVAELTGYCQRVFTDTASGKHVALNPGLRDALAFLRTGDTLMVWKLDRLGRSLRRLLELVNDLEARGVNLRSLTDGIDTRTPAGRFFFHMMGALAQMERELIVERTRAGMASARAAGKAIGRPRNGPLSDRTLRIARSLFAAGADVPTVAGALGVSVRTVYRRVPVPLRQIDFIESTLQAHDSA